jgi:hypothetical protein
LVGGGPKNSKFIQNGEIEISESNSEQSERSTHINKMPQMSPLVKSVLPNEIFYPIDGPNTQELQNVKNMILTLQLDLQEERTKREHLEEKVRNFERNLTWQSQEIPQRKYRPSEMRDLNEEISKSQIFSPSLNSTQGVDQKIAELRTDFDLRLRSLDQSLVEIRSILTSNLIGGPKGDRKMSLGVSPSEDKDYNKFLYKKLERGVFPPHISLKSAIKKSVDELVHKPWAEKTEIEALMDQYYLDSLPQGFLPADDIENDIENADRRPVTQVESQLPFNLASLNKDL